MVNNKFLSSFALSTFIGTSVFANIISLTPQDVATQVIQKSKEAEEINLRSELGRLQQVRAQSILDYNLTLQTGYENDRSESIASPNNNLSENVLTNLNLSKALITGTLLSFDYSRLSSQSELTAAQISAGNADKTVFDQWSLGIEQPVWQNSFGQGFRSNIEASELNFRALNILKVDNLEELVLRALRQYWATYVALKNFEEAQSARDRYEKLVGVLKRKASFGYTNPGELPQVLAEFASKDQNVKTQSANYLEQLDQLTTLLGLPKNSQIDFKVPTEVPGIPQLPKLQTQNLRAVQSGQLQIEASDKTLQGSASNHRPDVSLIAKVGATAVDEEASAAMSELVGSNNPNYYLGIRFKHSFGSDLKDEEIANAKINKRLAEVSLLKKQDEIENAELKTQRKLQVLYFQVQSLLDQKKYREQAMNEINRGYNQGRSDINQLINTMNNFFSTQVDYSRNIGDYHIALNELAAIRDQLIPDENKKEKTP